MPDKEQSTILVVDDREENRYVTWRILSRAGYKILEAATGKEALQLAAEKLPDLIVLDVHLPDMDGFEVCRVIKTTTATSTIPVLHLSASFVNAENRVYGLDCGADGYLTQPVQADEIVATVRALLRAHHAEEELRRTNERLAAQAEALERANQQLAEADMRKDDFLAMLAHELRNPLAPIRFAVELLDMAGAASPEQLRKQCEVIQRQVSHMSHLLDDLLDVSRVTRGKIHLHKETVDLRTIVEQAIEGIRMQVQDREQTLKYQRPAEPIHVHGDPTRLEQIVRNLLDNAHKYTESGGTISVTVSVLNEDGTPQAEVRVADTGAGINPAILPYIFEPFVQAEQSLARTQGGLGIGLAMVKNLILMHGGSVDAKSSGQGRGSEFIVTLPLAEPAKPVEPKRIIPQSNQEAGSQRVLVVDDNIDSASSLSELLELWGHDVRTCHDGTSALVMAREWQPNFILLDIGLPGMDGYEVARQLRLDEKTNGAVLVALTGYGAEEDRRRAQSAGFNEHLTKPVDLGRLGLILQQKCPN